MKDWQAEWVDVNNRAVRAMRIRRALTITAAILAIVCATLLGLIIFNTAIKRAAADAAIAPLVMRF